MFLKSMELSGFKSFADRTVINFEEGVTGIVGPNGCGKSNINDAIRWVLGEQSGKSLRSGSSMSELVFAGSESRKAVGMARVTLVFDNSMKIFDSPFEEIEITREIRRATGESSCYINKTPCRLKDISDLVMDTGLGRDSLSIITQGNISTFADAKPEERRLLFEEAAGVAKYKKRKKTSLAKLENVSANLERVQDQIDALQKQMESLEEQAQKAKEYTETRDQLANIEISLLASQIAEYEGQLKKLNERISTSRIEEGNTKIQIQDQDEQLSKIKSDIFRLDQQISALQSEYTRVMEESYALQKRKVEQDEKRKYALEKADASRKAEALQPMAAEARYEMEDRETRIRDLREKMAEEEADLRMLSGQIEQADRQMQALNSQLQNLKNRSLILENRIQAPYAHQQGVNAVLKARKSLDGIEGTVGQLLDSDYQYAMAIQAALGGSADQVVTRDERCARDAISFLKRSKAGRATFLPLTVCKPRSLYPDQKVMAENLEGILGTADSFVHYDQKYSNLCLRLLGNILVADDLKHANDAARTLKYQIKIVTLDGDTVHAGGAMSGGSARGQNRSAAAMKKELQDIRGDQDRILIQLSQLSSQRNALQRKAESGKEAQVQKRIDLEKLESIYRIKKEKYEDIKSQLAALNVKVNAEDVEEDSLVKEISDIHARMDSVSSALSLARNQRMELSEQADDLENKLRGSRRALNAVSADLHSDELEKTRVETKMEQALMRLNTDYSLTYEAASAYTSELKGREAELQVKKLRSKLQSLGDVNLQAPAMYEKAKEDHDFLASQKEELEMASAKILDAIDEMDQTMITQFSEMFHKINDQLDGIFKAMFGGGRASLSMTDPEHILETGIDIDVQPPGKTVKNIQTFSGGEKALIAISVLFAILKARTMPLCIFDEVEAALDQANVERFARYLSRFKDQSQFIVVTHRPGTMAQCDSLYGVTMQKDGVSKVLRVLLSDLTKQAEHEPLLHETGAAEPAQPVESVQ